MRMTLLVLETAEDEKIKSVDYNCSSLSLSSLSFHQENMWVIFPTEA